MEHHIYDNIFFLQKNISFWLFYDDHNLENDNANIFLIEIWNSLKFSRYFLFSFDFNENISFQICWWENIYLFFNSLLITIGEFNFICKIKFCNFPNFVTRHFLKIWYVSNMCMIYHLSILNFVEFRGGIFFWM